MKSSVINCAVCISEMGKKRQNNEDNFYFDGQVFNCEHKNNQALLKAKVPQKNLFLAGVFDGMGGEAYGEVASFLCAKTTKSMLKTIKRETTVDFLKRTVNKMNEEVCSRAKKIKQSMGSTASFICVTENDVTICNVGDSCIYSFNQAEMHTLSVEHTEAETIRRIDPSLIKPGKKYPLTQFIGISPKEMRLEPHFYSERAESGTKYLLCTDGLTDMVELSEIKEIVSGSETIEKSAEKLINKALESGGKDNITLVIVEV